MQVGDIWQTICLNLFFLKYDIFCIKWTVFFMKFLMLSSYNESENMKKKTILSSKNWRSWILCPSQYFSYLYSRITYNDRFKDLIFILCVWDFKTTLEVTMLLFLFLFLSINNTLLLYMVLDYRSIFVSTLLWFHPVSFCHTL